MAEWIPLEALAVRPHAGRALALTPAGTLDHAWFRAQAARWRMAFAAQPGQRWALHFADAAAFAAALYGAWHAGKQVYLCADVLPDTLARLAGEVDGLAGEFPEDAMALPRCAPNPAGEDDGDGWPALDPAATRLVIYTSGSTGMASAIEKRLAQLTSEVGALEASFGPLLGNAVVQGTVSHLHIYGLLFRVLWPLAAGRVIAPRVFFHEEIVAALDAPAVLVSSPAHLKRIPQTVDWAPARARLRAVFSSGGALPEDAAVAAAAAFGRAPVEIYGSSETGGVAWRSCIGASSAWTPLPGVEWRICDGQLELVSPHLPEPGWWRSSDRAEADAAGGFRLLGRADRIVKVEERRVSLTALERELTALPAVAEARVLLLNSVRATLAAVVVASAEGRARLQENGRRRFAAELQQALATGHDPVTRPRRWRFVDALPLDGQGKTSEAALRLLFRPQRPQPQWLQRDAGQALLEFDLDPALVAFDGHFPGYPILPGIAQLDWAVRFGHEAFALPPDFLRLEALKFQQVATPGLRLQLRLEWLAAKSALAFRYDSARGAHASGRVVFAGATG